MRMMMNMKTTFKQISYLTHVRLPVSSIPSSHSSAASLELCQVARQGASWSAIMRISLLSF